MPIPMVTAVPDMSASPDSDEVEACVARLTMAQVRDAVAISRDQLADMVVLKDGSGLAPTYHI
jgi:hypothetical protein